MSIHFGGFNTDCAVDCYGFRKSDDFDEQRYRAFVNSYLPVLARRLKRWEGIIRLPGLASGMTTMAVLKKRFTKRKLQRFIEKGIPASMRPRVWMAISGAESAALSRPGAFEAYSCTRLPSDIVNAIEMDLGRTFPDNEYFQSTRGNGRVALKQILRALAAKRPSIGYCQGFNFIAGMLLLILKSPENAFWLMDVMLDRFPVNFYDSNMRGLRVELLVLEKLIKERAPDIHGHMSRLDADLPLLTTKWFVCWFVESLPVETVYRLWDCLFGDAGPDVLTRAAFTIISHHKDALLRCVTFQQVVALFQKDMIADDFALNCHPFIQDVSTNSKWLTAGLLNELRRSVTLEKDI